VVLSVTSDLPLAAATVRDGGQDYLVKGSFDGPLLLRSVRYAVERKRSEEALRHTQATVGAVFANSMDGIVICDDQGQCLEANEAATRFLALSRKSLIGRNMIELPCDGFQKHWEQIRRDGQVRVRFWVKRGDGVKRLVDGNFTANILPGQHLGIMRDVTEQQGMEEQLRYSQKMEAVGRLAGGVAHDFNNILGTIRGYAELVQKDAEQASQAARAGKILAATDRAASLTRQLLAFGRKEVVAPELLDIGQLIKDSKTMITCMMGPETQIDIREEQGLGLVNADRIQIEQLVLNLAANGRDAMPQGGMLAIAVEDYDGRLMQPELSPGKYVRISFSDTGSGMDQETQLRIFEPFFTTKHNASGLGLSTVYGIVQQSGGYIAVQSAPMQGATFVVYLPVAAAAVRKEHAAQKKAPGDLRGDETILLVDDEDDLRNAAAEYLESFGYKVLSAGSGTEAIEISDRYPGKISLLISDIMMPKLSGPAVVDYILKKRPDIPVVVISGFADDEMRNHQALMRSACFVQKPFTLQVLVAKIRTILDQVAEPSLDRISTI